MLEWINDRKNYYFTRIKEGKNYFKDESLIKFLSMILMKKDNSTGWTEISKELNDSDKLNYLEQKNLIVKKRIEVKLKTILLEKIVKELSI